ncbi:MAG: glycosyltransferase family 4 protein [Clostridiales bacterium]|nr:glycosyltransferase family 4 protein [Clostridiales bacterium]
MRILTFSAYFTPEIAASMYLSEDIFEAMAKEGHFVDLYVPTPCRGISNEVRKQYKRKKTEVKYDGHLIIHRFRLYKEGKNTLLRALRYAFLVLKFFWFGLKQKTDAIFVQSTPPVQGMMAGLLASVKKVPLIYNLQDIFPDSLVNSGMTQSGSLIWKIGRWVENFSYKRTSRFIVISDDFKRNIIEKGVSPDKITVVPNWADTSSVYPVVRENNKLIDKYHLNPSDFMVVYSGNIGFSQNIDLLLDVAKALAARYNQLKFVLIGDGAAKKHIEERIKNEKAKNVVLIPFQPYEDIAHVFSLGDAGLIISKPGVGDSSVPSKTWSIMAAGKPVLASFDLNSELCNLIESVGCGVCASAGNADDLIRAIEFLMNNNKEFGINGYEYVKNNRSSSVCLPKYIKAIEDAVESANKM